MPGPIYEEVRRLFNEAYYPGAPGPSAKNAWLGIYEVLLTYEYDVPQVFDKDALEEGAWRRRALQFEAYLAEQLQVPAADVAGMVGQLMQHPHWRGKQINNPRGHGFRTIVAHLLRQANPSCQFEEEALAQVWFPGIHLPGASKRGGVDVLAVKNDRPRAVISCKWTMRHDRISDITNECPIYKSAAQRQRLKPFEHFVVTNESNPARLDKMLEDDCLDGVVHVHTKALQAMEINGRTAKVMDLADFLAIVTTW